MNTSEVFRRRSKIIDSRNFITRLFQVQNIKQIHQNASMIDDLEMVSKKTSLEINSQMPSNVKKNKQTICISFDL